MTRFGLRRNPVVQRRADGRYDVVLAPGLRAVTAALLGELDQLIEEGPDGADLSRLSPPAYPDDPDKDAEYQLLAGDELRTARRESIATVLASLEADEVTDDQLWSWLRSLNALRLVVGTRLGIDDEDDDDRPGDDLDPDDPEAQLWAAYELAGWLQGCVVAELQR